MSRFVIRRVLSMAFVLIVISILTFLIFQAIPDGDPAQRLAGRTATPETIATVRHSWGFDKPIYVQYFTTMGKIFSGTVISYTQQINVLDEIKKDLPATVSLALGELPNEKQAKADDGKTQQAPGTPRLGLSLAPAGDVQGLAYVRHHVATPVMADESVFGLDDLVEVIRYDAADLVNLKLAKK